jgi:hypothetical protein
MFAMGMRPASVVRPIAVLVHPPFVTTMESAISKRIATVVQATVPERLAENLTPASAVVLTPATQGYAVITADFP